MSLLNQIFTEEKKLVQEIVVPAFAESFQPDHNSSPNHSGPCQTCGYASTWLSITSDGISRCMVCDPPPSKSFVACVTGPIVVAGARTQLYGFASMNEHRKNLAGTVNNPPDVREFFLDHRGKKWWVEVDESRDIEVFSMDEQDRRGSKWSLT